MDRQTIGKSRCSKIQSAKNARTWLNSSSKLLQSPSLFFTWFTSTKLLLTDDEKDGADQHSSRQHMFCADLLRWFAHGAKLVSQWVSPEVGEKQSTDKEGKGTVSSTPGSLHLSTADGLHIELQDHHAEDDHPKRQDDRWPWLYFTLGNRYKEQIFANIVVAFVGISILKAKWE